MSEKTHWKKVFNKDYLGACDLEDNKDLKAVINHVEIREIKDANGTSSKRNIAIFDGNIKPMVLNVTNCKILKKFTNSPYIEDWKKIPVQIYAKNDVKAFGDIVEGLRFRETKPILNKPKLTKEMPAWTKAVEGLKNKSKTLTDVENVYDISDIKDELLREV